MTNDVKAPAGDAALDEFLGAPPARPFIRRPRTWIVAGLVLVMLLVFARCMSGGEEQGFATTAVKRGGLESSITATGNLQPTNQVEVGSEQSGLVAAVYVDNNDRVTKGQPLARLDTARLVDTIRQSEASLAVARSQVATAEATQGQARANLARLEEVYKVSGGKVPSATELDAARAEYRRAAAATRSAEAQVVQQRAALSSAETNLSRATIVSPVTGVVLSRSVDPGQTVAASFQAPVLFTIAEDLSTMRLEVKVDEADVGQVREGQAARFTVDAFPGESFPARLIRVDLGANASGGSGSATTGSAVSSNQVVAYTAVLTVDNPKLILRPGMTATARIISAEVKNTLLVPNAALRFSPERVPTAASQGGLMSGPPRPDRDAKIGRGSRQSVYILGADGKPSRVDVVTGRSDGSWTAVSGAGLKPGVKVITGRLADAP